MWESLVKNPKQYRGNDLLYEVIIKKKTFWLENWAKNDVSIGQWVHSKR